jgi:DNA-binding transcriptional regulator GbsR (MarR family)
MTGRILGWLMIVNQPHQSTSQLVEALSATKSSVSSATNLLIRVGFLERVSLPGERVNYFRLRPAGWQHMMNQRVAQISMFRRTLEHGMKLLEGKDQANREWLEEMLNMYTFLERELPAWLERWQEERQASKSGV